MSGHVSNKINYASLESLSVSMDGELLFDDMMRVLYATDASVYRALPIAVAYPRNEEDIVRLIEYSVAQNTYLIPRAAGTSLAGQTVGEGIVFDCSKHLNTILEINTVENWALVEPGVVRDRLNAELSETGLFFGPITSTANRATIGGMVGNNSSGTNSIIYGTTRDKVIEIHGILSDGSTVIFRNETSEDYSQGMERNTLYDRIRTHLYSSLSNPLFRDLINENYPKKSIHRRNTGYALDALADSQMFGGVTNYNIGRLICGSEGTLMMITKVKIALDPIPPPHQAVIALHCNSIDESLRATQLAMEHKLYACELMDKIILDCTKENELQNSNRFFVEGDPEAILLLDIRHDTEQGLEEQIEEIVDHLKSNGLGYPYPIIHGDQTKKVWQLRSAGLGLLANLKGDAKAVACIEDTAVDVSDLPNYIADFNNILEQYGQRSVHYAHAGAGEIHLRPILDLKKESDREQFYSISKSTAELVKSYNGSLSGEHGDGRVRAPFIPMMVGPEIYQFYHELKKVWDPNNIFNRGKILDAEPMNESLRYGVDQNIPEPETIFDFSDTNGFIRAAEKCNGSGDCRKLPLSGGTMCPSYQATRNEKDTTRARANILREYLTRSSKSNRFDHEEVKDVLDLCLSCKACTSECPSNVNMTIMKSEFQYQYYKDHRIPIRSLLFAYINDLNRLGSIFPWLYNVALRDGPLSNLIKKLIGVHRNRSLPLISHVSLRKWYKREYRAPSKSVREVILFTDEFTNHNDVEVGIKAIKLLSGLGYHVILTDHQESGRAAFSKGLLKKAKRHAEYNVEQLSKIVSEEIPLLGIEPSAILSFRDEYPRIVGEHLRNEAEVLKSNSFTIEEFIAQEFRSGRVDATSFTSNVNHVKLHGHCHQKALSEISDTVVALSIPPNYHVELIPSGCCGMAGSFGYEEEHYDVSRQVAELVLLPALSENKISKEGVICAPGTSCRHQIKDLANKTALHPVEILFDALNN